jgi:FeS assembly SUF system protein
MAEELKGKTGNEAQDANGKKALKSENLYDVVVTILKNCYDPEIPVNIYELGLIYDIQTAENNDVLVVMTLTSPACPVAGSLPIEIQDKLKEHPMINDARVEITFDPPWSFDNMSEEAKYELGFI